VQGRWVLSGGLASGKSAVRRLLEESGVETIDADAIGHQVLELAGPAYESVAETWPAVATEGAIDRGALAEIVFNDPSELARLESITHPFIFEIIRRRVDGVDGPAVVEIPVLGHGLGEDWGLMVVDCSDEVRLRRALERGMDEADARARMASQPSRTQWLAAADLVVPNHGSLDDLKSTVASLSGQL